MKKYLGEIVILVILLPVIIYLAVDWDKPTQKKIRSVTIEGDKMAVSNVHAEKIPQAIYDGISDNPQYKEFFLGNKKHIVMLTWDGCPYRVAFKNKVKQALAHPALKKKYNMDIVPTGQTFYADCNSNHLNCPTVWVANHCMGSICIINPQTKEAIIDDSHDPEQILPLAAAYVNWDEEPLIKEKKTN